MVRYVLAVGLGLVLGALVFASLTLRTPVPSSASSAQPPTERPELQEGFALNTPAHHGRSVKPASRSLLDFVGTPLPEASQANAAACPPTTPTAGEPCDNKQIGSPRQSCAYMPLCCGNASQSAAGKPGPCLPHVDDKNPTYLRPARVVSYNARAFCMPEVPFSAGVPSPAAIPSPPPPPPEGEGRWFISFTGEGMKASILQAFCNM